MCGRFYITKWLQVLLLYLHFLWCIIGISPYNKGEMPLGQGGKVVYVQHSSVAQLCPTLYNPMDCNMPGFPILHHLLELAQTYVHWVCDAFQPSHPLLLPSVFPSIRIFSSELAVCIMWLKHWSFSFSISPSNEYSVISSSNIFSHSVDFLSILLMVSFSVQKLLSPRSIFD